MSSNKPSWLRRALIALGFVSPPTPPPEPPAAVDPPAPPPPAPPAPEPEPQAAQPDPEPEPAAPPPEAEAPAPEPAVCEPEGLPIPPPPLHTVTVKYVPSGGEGWEKPYETRKAGFTAKEVCDSFSLDAASHNLAFDESPIHPETEFHPPDDAGDTCHVLLVTERVQGS